MTNNTKTRKGDQVLQIRYTNDTTRTDFLEIRAHFNNHEDALTALIDFWKKNNKPVMKGTVT
jgi:hypothetical protein